MDIGATISETARICHSHLHHGQTDVIVSCCRTLKYSHPPQKACFEDRNDHFNRPKPGGASAPEEVAAPASPGEQGAPRLALNGMMIMRLIEGWSAGGAWPSPSAFLGVWYSQYQAT